MKKLTLFAIALLASVVSFALNPFAYNLSSSLSDDGATLAVKYTLNAEATGVKVVILNGEDEVKTVDCADLGLGKGDYTVAIPTEDLPTGVDLTWKVVVTGTSVEVPTQETKMYNLYCPHGLAIDKDPESEYFGRILVAEAMQGVPASGYVTSGKGAGLYVFNPSFTTDSVAYKGGNDFTRILASNGYQPYRVKISEDGRIFVSSLDLNGVVVWEVSKDLQTWTPVIAGTNDATDYNIYDAGGNFVAGINCSMDVIGSGENLKLLLYSTNNKGIAFNQSGYRLDEYALGTATTWTGLPKNILEGGKYGVVHTNVEFIYDGEGGYWFGGSRAGNAGQPNLVHINAEGVEDYRNESNTLYGGDGVLVHNGMLFKGKLRTSSTVGNFGVWTIGKDADGKVTLTEKWSVVANGIGRNLNEFAVDYAENLYIVGNSGEKIIAYALPYDGNVATPAASKYAFQLEAPATPEPQYQVIEDEITNFVFDLEAWPMVCMGGPSTNYQVEVYLVLTEDADGTLSYEDCSVSIMGQDVTLIEGTLSNMDVYAPSADAVLRVQMGEEYYELHLAMSAAAPEPIEVVVENATVTLSEYEVSETESAYELVMIANWTYEKDGLTYEVECLLPTFDPTNESGNYAANFYVRGDGAAFGMAEGANVLVTVENQTLKLTGEISAFNGNVYNVTISGTLPVEEPVEMVGVVKRALQNGEGVVVLTHEADGTPHIYNMVGETITEVSQEGVVPVNPANEYDYLSISDIALTDDGKLVACNYIRCAAADPSVGTTRYYIWNDLAGAPALWFTSYKTGNSTLGDVGYTFAVKGVSTNAQVMTTAVHNKNRAARINLHTIVNGVEETSKYHRFGLHTTDSYFTEAKRGVQFQLSTTPLDGTWAMDGDLANPAGFTIPSDVNAGYVGTELPAEVVLGKKYNGASYVTCLLKELMVAPYADAEGKLAGVKVIDITAGFATAKVIKEANLDAPVAATAAATAVAVAENVLTVTLVADAEVHTLTIELDTKPETHTITATANIAERGYIEGLENEGVYEAGDEVTLRAVANDGYEFVDWSNGSTDNPLTFVVKKDENLVANFRPVLASSITLNALPVQDYSTSIVGTIKRAIQNGENTIVLTHEADGTPHIYNVAHATKTVTEISQEGVVARDPDNVGDYLSISDIALTDDGKLVACNYIRCQNTDAQVDAGYKRGTNRFYIWDELTGAAKEWFTEQFAGNSYRADAGYTMALKGSSTDCNVLVTVRHYNAAGAGGSDGSVRMHYFTIAGGEKTSRIYLGWTIEPTAPYYTHTIGENMLLSSSPIATMNFIMDANLTVPSEFQVIGDAKDVTILGRMAADSVSAKYNGASCLPNYNEHHLLLTPYANEEGDLAGVKVLDIADGLTGATELITNTDLATAENSTAAAATAVVDAEGKLTIHLFADAKVYTFTQKEQGPATAIDNNTAVAPQVDKILRNGQVLIIRDGKTFNMMGQEVK